MAATKDKMLIIYDDRTCELLPVKEVADQHIETTKGLYPIEDTQTLFDTRNSNIVYVTNLNTEARVEAAKLKQLRRSTALLRMFEFDAKAKPFDMMSFMPWVIIIALLLFK